MIPLPQPEVAKRKSLALAATVHLLLIAALFFGVQWKSQAPSSVEVEVWRAAPAPSPAPTVKPEPKPEPKVELKPEPKPEVKPPVKPDIVVKEEKKPPKKEDPKKLEPERPRVNFEEEIKRDQKEREKEKTVQEQRIRAATEANQLNQAKNEQAAAARKRGEDAYRNAIRGAIRNHIVLPAGIQGNPKALFEVTQLPSGDILPPVKILQSSGNASLDAAIERAILKASPLPKPESPDIFQRILKIPYQPFEQ